MRALFTNAIFHTMESAEDTHTSMTIENGTIAGFDEAVEDFSGKVIDLGGAHVFPALIDAHLHMIETIAITSVGVPLCSVHEGRIEPHDLAGIEDHIRTHAAIVKPDSLIIFSNYISAAIVERRLPTRFELDEWTNGARVWVMNIDGHSSSCSSKLLGAIGLAELAPDGILVGEAHDANLGVITDYLASCMTPKVLAQGIADFCNECASYGIGTVCALEGTDDLERDKVAEATAFLAQRLPLDVRLFPQYVDEKKVQAILPRMGTKRVGGCMKWELDGSIGSRTAAFSHPYTDGSQGSLYFDSNELFEHVKEFAEKDYLVSAHAIGELAIDQLVDILERVPGRHRIDHCEFPSPNVLPRLYALQPYITVQPGYAWMDKHYLHGYESFLDARIIQQQVPLKDLAEHGVVLCGSSDAPVQSVDPYLQMRGMREFYVEEQSLSAFEALKTYTVNGGEMLGEKKGLLHEGYEASFFVIDTDLLTIDPSGLEDIHAEALYLHGKRYKQMSRSLGALMRLLLSSPRKI